MIVVDTNVLVNAFVTGRQTPEAESVLNRDPQWAAPLLWRSEFRNTLVVLVRHHAVDLDRARGVTRDAERMMADREYTVLSEHVLELAASSGCSAYDCEFVAVAENLGVPLVTFDTRVLRAFPARALRPADFVG